MTKMFFTQTNIGRVRYAVNFHNGVKLHRDGSRFYDLRCFGNKRKALAFIRALRCKGYVERTRVEGVTRIINPKGE